MEAEGQLGRVRHRAKPERVSNGQPVRAPHRSASFRASLPRALAGVALTAIVYACGTPPPTVTPRPSVAMTPTPWASTATPSPTATLTPKPTTFPIAVVVRYDDTSPGISPYDLVAALAAGKITVPCEVTEIGFGPAALTIAAATPCLPAAAITAKVHDTPGLMALLPPGLVTPSVKVLAVGNADLFGGPSHRGDYYQLFATVPDYAVWTGYDVSGVRTLISTGDTCPDTGVSYMAVGQKKGWPWVLDGGTVHYRGLKMDTTFSGPSGNGWPVPIIVRNGDSGKLGALISDNDVSANDFECPMISNWVQHSGVMVFNVDPKVATTLAQQGGLKVVTLGSNHITDQGQSGVLQTLSDHDAAGIKHTGAGATLADALAPAVVDVRGIKFAFVGWDDISGSAAATATRPGVAPLTDDNVCSSIKAARAVADIVIAMPQWGWPEYHATITKTQETQRAFFYSCGADDILGSGTHWASWASILPGPNGPQFAIGSHGNFLFTQTWSRQTMEGVVVEATFYGKTLVQFRLHPYVVVQGAQPNLLDPTTDGAYVLHQVWSVSDVR
jgi:hypothetical protein